LDIFPSSVRAGTSFDLVVKTPFAPQDPLSQRVMIVTAGATCTLANGAAVLPQFESQHPTSATASAAVWHDLVFNHKGFYEICYCVQLSGCSPERVAVSGSDAFVKIDKELQVVP